MPCRSDYLEPTAAERATNLVARLMLYVFPLVKEGWEPSPILEHNAKAAYSDTSLLHVYTDNLCSVLKDLSEEELNRIVYDGRNKTARELADWWEAHQELDNKREAQERNDEYVVNCVVGYIKTELELAKKQNRPLRQLSFRQHRPF